jgi:hypothetical protein
VGLGHAITHRVPKSPTLHGAHPPADSRVADVEVVGDLLLGVPVLEVRACDAGGVFCVGDEGCESMGADRSVLADFQMRRVKICPRRPHLIGVSASSRAPLSGRSRTSGSREAADRPCPLRALLADEERRHFAVGREPEPLRKSCRARTGCVPAGIKASAEGFRNQRGSDHHGQASPLVLVPR